MLQKAWYHDMKNFDSSRQPTKQHSLDEMIIAEEGAVLHHADEILE